MKKLLFLIVSLAFIGLALSSPDPLHIVGALIFIGTGGTVFFGKVSNGVLGAAGDFSAAELDAIQGLVDQYWSDNTINKDYVGHVDAALAIRENQTARLGELQGQKDRTLELIWVKDCENRLADCTDDCVVGGAELEAASQSYTMDLCKTAGFNVKEKEFRTLALDREEVVAKGILSTMKQLDEWLTQQAISHLNTFAGINQYEDGVFSGAEFNEADAAFWNADLFGEFNIISQLNQFKSPFLLSGTNLYKEYWNAQMTVGNANDKDKLMKFGTMPMYFDLWNMNTVNTPDKVTYMLDRGSVALVTKAYNPITPMVYTGAGLTKYKVASKNIAGIEYDVVYTNDCTSNEITHKWSFYVNGLCALNPLGCSADNTGVLKFYCGTASGS